MELSNCVVIFKDGERHFGATLEGIITGTFNDNNGGIYVQAPNKQPVPVFFSQVVSITVLG
jgi:hypothetical protein